MTDPSQRSHAALHLASAALLTAILGYVLLIFGSPFAGALPLRMVATVAAVALLASAAALLLRRRHPDARATPWVFAVAATLAAVAQVVFALSFAAGMDDGDAGRPLGLFGSLTWLFALAGVLLTAVAIAALTVGMLPRSPRLSAVARGAIAAAVAVVASVPAFLALLQPSTTAILALAVLIALIVFTRSSARPQGAGTEADAGAGPAVNPGPDANAGDRGPGTVFPHSAAVRWLGAVSLEILVLVWGGGAAVGTALAGTTAATTAMGVSAGAAPLAALPLILGLAIVLRARAPRNRLVFAAIPIAGVGAGVLVQLAFLSTEGTAMFVASGIAGLSVGAWFGILLLPALPRGAGVRAVTFGAITLGGVLAWFSAVTATGGIALAIPALVLLIAGPSLARVRPPSGAQARLA